ncbi:tyrosine-type recombinase/integrase [Bacillus mesophilum]|uniref:Tyrosine-type recombinase/integrase n=1 Tax=Bacillus mesophilum TaxID=1071718 RepID=A0A7V7RPD2_9BACI|nr:tyrosine-type recombinase/integrase [Bacillus mesophilum]KAB2335112.1 tyrosine-type recombinase/integrase [Bacillus mesophilum]
MPIELKLSMDHKKFCEELGISQEQLLNLLNQNQNRNTQSPKSSPNALVVIEQFLINLEKQEVSKIKAKNSFKYYKSFLSRFKNFLLSTSPDLLLEDLNQEHLYDFLQICKPRKSNGVSLGTQNTYIAILKKLVSFSLEQGLISKDIRYRFEKTSYSLLPRYFSPKQLRTILTKAKKRTHGYLWSAIFITLLGTGLRVHELVNLRIKDFNLQTQLIYTKGKGQKERYVPIYPEIASVVLKYLKTTGMKTWDINNEGYLFSRDFGVNRNKAISIRSIQYNMKQIINEMQLENHFSVHSFRHTFAVNALKANMRLEYLCQILGHSSPDTTAIYTKLVPNDLLEEVTQRFPFHLENLILDYLSEEI